MTDNNSPVGPRAGSALPAVVVRSLLFVPGTRPDRIAKALATDADAVVVDLEDAVSPADKAAARTHVAAALAELDHTKRPRKRPLLVRVNPVGSPWFADDLEFAAGADGVVLPKYQRASDLIELRDRVGAMPVIVGIETALGVADSRALLSIEQSPQAVYFGAEDFIADLGGRRTRDGDEVLYARSQVCLAARVANIAAIDQAVVDLADDDRFRQDAHQGRALGYAGKICIHPRQVPLANAAFSPSPEELARAEAVLRASADGVAVFDGQMIDEVHIRLASQVLARGKQVTCGSD